MPFNENCEPEANEDGKQSDDCQLLHLEYLGQLYIVLVRHRRVLAVRLREVVINLVRFLGSTGVILVVLLCYFRERTNELVGRSDLTRLAFTPEAAAGESPAHGRGDLLR